MMDGTVSRKLLVALALAGMLVSLGMSGCKPAGRAERKCVRTTQDLSFIPIFHGNGFVQMIPIWNTRCVEWRARPRHKGDLR